MARRNFIDADDSLMEKNLRFIRNDVEDNLNQYFGAGSSNSGNAAGTGAGLQAPPRDYKVVQPKPGFCLKTFKTNTNEKYFINVCQTDEIPPPEDISEEKLTEILQSDSPSSFRIPMSISEPRITKDKSNNPVDACDIALNTKFFQKIERSLLFKNFFIALVAEALSEKYNVQLNIDKSIVLNNRKFIGTLVQHRVRNNDVKTVLNSYEKLSEADKKQLQALEAAAGGGKKRNPLVQEIDSSELQKLKQKSDALQPQKTANSAKIKQEISQAGSIEPEYKLRARIRQDEVKEIQAEFYLPKCVTINDITLDVGEDRILLESMKYGYLFDKFVNYSLNQEGARAIFDKTNRMLQLRVPIIPV